MISRGQKVKETGGANKQEEDVSKKDSKNLYEVELSHSQSEKVIHYKRPEDEEEPRQVAKAE